MVDAVLSRHAGAAVDHRIYTLPRSSPQAGISSCQTGGKQPQTAACRLARLHVWPIVGLCIEERRLIPARMMSMTSTMYGDPKLLDGAQESAVAIILGDRETGWSPSPSRKFENSFLWVIPLHRRHISILGESRGIFQPHRVTTTCGYPEFNRGFTRKKFNLDRYLPR